MNIQWLKSKPNWLRYATIGSISYPLLILTLMLLSVITTPLGLGDFFTILEGILLLPVYFITLFFMDPQILSAYNSFTGWRVQFLVINFLFTCIFGFIIGSVVGIIKEKSHKRKE